jgi:hypothetical protein
MNYSVKKLAIAVSVFGSMSLFAHNAVASVAFDSYATINFSVASISADGGAYSGGLSTSGSFLRSGDYFPDIWTDTTGDANVTDNNPEIPAISGPVVVGTNFSHSFALDGSASNGMIDFDQVGWYDLGFKINDNVLQVFDITLNFSYDIHSQVTGQEGVTGVSIEYFDDVFETYGYDLVEASSVQPELAIAQSINGGQMTFTLDPFNNSRIFYVNVNHTGHLEASPVPLPPSAWLFLSGVFGVFGLKKRNVSV